MAERFPAATLKPADHRTASRAAARIAESALASESAVTSASDAHAWFAERARADVARVKKIALDELTGWSPRPGSGDIAHDSGRFFTVEGLEVTVEDLDAAPGTGVRSWAQPIINQSEVGILGILAKEFDGILHFLLQAKNEPGNRNGVQLSPTVQATRSNYTRVHGGQAVPYLKYFRQAGRHRLLADVLQSEQGSWFYRKQNRNMVVEVEEDVEVRDEFRWLTLGQIHRLLARDDVINMDTRTVLACLPFAGSGLAASLPRAGGTRSAISRSCSDDLGGLHSTGELLSWITEARARTRVRTRRIPLDDVRGWSRTRHAVSHDGGRYFQVVAVDVTAGHREVRAWTQPMIEPRGNGVVAFLVADLGGVAHVLVCAHAEPGFLNGVELGPSVQCVPANYDDGDRPPRLRFLDRVLDAPADRVLFDAVLSEEGGRFYHARNRYMIVELDGDHRVEDDGFRWVPLHQLAGLLRHGHYLNVEARSLIACLYSLAGGPGGASRA